MKTVNLDEARLDLAAAIELARQEPLLLVTPTGQELVLAEADDFDREVEILRNSVGFQRFLDERSQSPRRIDAVGKPAEVDRP